MTKFLASFESIERWPQKWTERDACKIETEMDYSERRAPNELFMGRRDAPNSTNV